MSGIRQHTQERARSRFVARVLCRLLTLHEAGRISRAQLWRLWRCVLVEGYGRH